MELPLFTTIESKALATAGGFLLTVMLSGHVVRFFFPPPQKTAVDKAPEHHQGRFDPSVVIGKMENILTLMFILADSVTGIALIITGKSLVRKEEIRKNPGFFLGGTLVNLTWAALMGFLMRLAILGH